MADVDVDADLLGEPRVVPSRRRWVPLAFLIGVLLTQVAWAWGTPPFRGIDEIDHAFRASSVAAGDVRSSQLPADGRGALVEVPPQLVSAARAQCQALKYDGPSNCVPERTLPDGNVLIASSAAAYSPVFYAIVGTLARPFDGVTALYAMRTFASVIDALLLALAAWCLMTRSRTAWPITGLILGLTPMAVYTTMLPAPNGMELAAATVLWCSLLALQCAAPRVQGRLLAAAGLAGAILGCVRPTGPLFVLLIVATVALADLRRTRALVRDHWRGVLGVGAVTGTATLYQVHWILTQPPVSELDTRSPFDLGVVVTQVPLWVFQWIGAFPLRENPSSPITYLACLTAFVVVFVQALRRGDAKARIAIGVIVTGLILPLVFTLGTFTEKGTFWQGRYGLPFLIGAPILVGLSLDRPGHERPLIEYGVILVGLVSNAAAVIHLVHLELHGPASFADPHWYAPSEVEVIVLAVGAAVCFNLAIGWARGATVHGNGAIGEHARPLLRPPLGEGSSRG